MRGKIFRSFLIFFILVPLCCSFLFLNTSCNLDNLTGNQQFTAATVTFNDNGKSIDLKVGQSFVLNLGNAYDWTVNVGDSSIISQEINVPVVLVAEGVYKINKVGSCTLTAEGNPQCLKSNPPCGRSSIGFRVNIVVK